MLSRTRRSSVCQAFYHITKDPTFHQNAYALLTCGVVFRGMYVMKANLTPALRERNPQKADVIMKQMWTMAFTGGSLGRGVPDSDPAG